MLEPISLSHPTDDDLQRLADGDVDAGSDASLVAHVDVCPQCRGEIERVQRVTAALSLSSVAPDALLGKITQRRAQGAMQPPLRTSSVRSSRRLRLLLPAGLAAAAIIAVFAELSWRSDPPPGAMKAKAALQPAARFIIGIGEWRQPAMDSVMAALRERHTRADISFSRTNTKSPFSGRQLADSIARYLLDRGIDTARVTVTQRTASPDLPSGFIAIEVLQGIPR